MELEKLFNEKDFTLNLNGTFGIPEIAEMLDFLKAEKTKTVETELKIGDRVYRKGYQEYGVGEVEEIEIYIYDSGDSNVVYTVRPLGSGYDGEFEKV